MSEAIDTATPRSRWTIRRLVILGVAAIAAIEVAAWYYPWHTEYSVPVEGSLWSSDVNAIKESVNSARGARLEFPKIQVLPTNDVLAVTAEGGEFGTIYQLRNSDGKWSVVGTSYWTKKSP